MSDNAPMPVPNLPLLRKVIDQVTAHPETWLQEDWATQDSCGTAYCIGGWAITMTGYSVVFDGCDDTCTAPGRSEKSEAVDIAGVAQRELGLTAKEAGDLFCGANDMDDILRSAKAIAARAGEEL